MFNIKKSFIGIFLLLFLFWNSAAFATNEFQDVNGVEVSLSDELSDVFSIGSVEVFSKEANAGFNNSASLMNTEKEYTKEYSKEVGIELLSHSDSLPGHAYDETGKVKLWGKIIYDRDLHQVRLTRVQGSVRNNSSYNLKDYTIVAHAGQNYSIAEVKKWYLSPYSFFDENTNFTNVVDKSKPHFYFYTSHTIEVFDGNKYAGSINFKIRPFAGRIFY